MANISSKIAQLRRKAFAGEIEVEDLIEMAVLGDARAVPLIRDLWAEFGWPRTNDIDGAHVVPLGRWAEVVCTYLEGGFEDLIEYALLPERESIYFATSLMSDIKTTACAHALAQLTVRFIDLEVKEPRAAYNLASAINLVLSFKDAPSSTVDDTTLMRKFLHELILRSSTEFGSGAGDLRSTMR